MRVQEIIRDLIDKLEALDASIGSPAPCDAAPEDESDTFVPPLQQEIELKKAQMGKSSEVVDELLDDEE